MTVQDAAITICPWRGGKRWVYSATFDEALSDLHRFAIPILEEYKVPGHLEVVVGHMGQIRKIGDSSYNGFKHMGADELREMIARGWGVGNHSWSHGVVNRWTADVELRQAREVLAEAIGQPVTLYCAPGSNANMNDEALVACRELQYLGAMSLTDALNRPDDADLLYMNRTFLHDQAPGPFFSEFDPYRNVLLARRDQGWIIDYLHCPLEEPVHRNKDCSQAQLRERIETIAELGGDEVWLANPDEAVDYRYTRRHAAIARLPDGSFQIGTADLSTEVRRRTVTLELSRGTQRVFVDGRPIDVSPRSDDRALVDVDLATPKRIRMG
jgi:peptidoglycan/xylan/chitin deacetylase (PgdA/CDA1 family)